jgi:leader peptidase (prepilin peptidase)/N-methyltransferase
MELLEVLQKSPAFLMVAVALLGLCVGSLLNVVIHRLPKMMEAQWREECAALEGREPPPAQTYNLFTPRSACPQCKAPISARYPFVEVLGAALALLVAWRFGYSAALAFGLVFVWVMLALTFIDLDTQLLPDDLTLPLLWLGLLANAFGTYIDLRSAVLGAAGGYMLLWAVYWAFRLLAKKEGMGFGDFKLLAAIGAWTGWQVLPVVIVVSAGLGALIGSLVLWMTRRGIDARIPFGPYLALGGIVGLIWGREAVTAWVGHFPV